MDRRGAIPNRARISNKLTMAKLYHNSKNIEDVRALRETNKLDIETLVHLTGYKEWIYTKDMAEALVSEAEGRDDWYTYQMEESPLTQRANTNPPKEW